MKRLFNIFLMAAILAVSFVTMDAPVSTAHAAENTGLSTEQLLNQDGTLNLDSGFNGLLDISGYNVNLDPLSGPVFSPLMTINAWSALGTGISGLTGSGSVRAIAINGTNLYIGGTFVDAAGDTNADRIAVWDGSSWSALGSGIGTGQVSSLAFHGSDLYVGGTFTDAGGNTAADYIAKWDGSTWSTLGDGLNSTVNAVAVSGPNIYIAGNFTNAGVDPNADYIAKLDGGTWAALGANPLNNAISALAVAGATVYAGGAFTDFAAGGNTNLSHIATWDGSSWSAMGSGLNNSVFALTLVGGDLYVGGAFTNAGGNTSADLIAKWDGSAWSALGSGLPSVSVNAIVASGSNLYVGGNFNDAGGDLNADYIARWNGSAWSALGATALNNTVSAIIVNGLDLYAGGAFIDAGGNFNADRIALFQIDDTAPTVDTFTATSPSTSISIPITAFTASDNISVTGYKITESAAPPAASDTGWTASAPSTYTVASSGEYTLYPWAKDASGNISTVYGAPASVSVSCPATITVTSSADSGAGTLRQAITDLCADNGTINFNASLSGGTIRLNSTLTLSKNLIINGSALATKITISGDTNNDTTGDVRVFTVNSGVTVTLDSLAITKGFSNPNGGGISNSGTLTITNSTLSGNSATYGGGIYNDTGTLTIMNSTFLGNTASTNGGGIYNTATVAVTNSTFSGNTATTNGGGIYTNGTTVTVTNSTFSSNSALSRGGGIYNSNAPLTVTSSTFSGNTATLNGGGIYNNNAALTVTNDTFSGNTASNNGGGIFTTSSTLTSTNSTFSANTANNIGGGIYVNTGTLNYANTIIANSTAGDCVNAGTLGTNTNNLVENGSCSASLSGDPRLDALANNGGPTQTLAPDLGSPVLDAGDDTICAAAPVSNLDQRGVTRPVGAHCDIGAYEGAIDISAPTVTAFTVSSPVASLNIPITNFTASDNGTVSAYLITESSSQPSAGAAGWTASAPTTYTVAGSGSYTLYPWAKDMIGNVSAVYGSPASVSVDNAAPTVTAFSVPSASSSLSIPITNFTASDNGTVSAYLITESSSQPSAGAAGWTASAPTTYTVASSGSYTLYPWAKDALGNVSAIYGSPASVSVDNAAPNVVSIARASTNPTGAASVDFTVTFSESVTGADTGDFSLVMNGVGSASISDVTGSGATRTVSVNTGSGDGSIRLDLLNNNSIQDSVGNSLSGSFTSGQSYTIDKTAPTVVSSVRANTSPTNIASVDFTVTFSEPISGVDTSDFSLTNIGVTGASVTNVSGSGAVYTVTVSTGSGIGTLRLDVLDDDSIQDAVNNPLGGVGVGNGNFANGEIYTIAKPANIDVIIAGANQGTYDLISESSTRQSYALNNGPVKVVSTNGVPFLVAERDAWLLNGVVQSFSEMMGLPGNQVTDTYYFPWYNNVTMDTQLRFANVGNTSTNITVTIAGVPQLPIAVAAGQSTRVSYPGINAGPVKVQSSGNVPIIVAERDAWLVNGVVQSFSEMMGLPGNQSTDTYYFPWYNNVTMDTQLRFANLGAVPTDITVTIAGIAQTPITVAAGESTRVSYSINNGPVKVQSSGGVPIIVAERDAWLINGVVRSFSEMMGLPGNQLTTSYYFPWYNNVTMDTQLRFANLGAVPTDITVTIAGVPQPLITVAAGTSTRISYPVNNGPVTVTSSGGVPIIVAERDAWLLNGAVRSFSEMMGLPGNQLTTTYYFPWYNNLTMDTQLRFAVP